MSEKRDEKKDVAELGTIDFDKIVDVNAMEKGFGKTFDELRELIGDKFTFVYGANQIKWVNEYRQASNFIEYWDLAGTCPSYFSAYFYASWRTTCKNIEDFGAMCKGCPESIVENFLEDWEAIYREALESAGTRTEFERLAKVCPPGREGEVVAASVVAYLV